MNIQLKKLELIEWITQINDNNIIGKMDNIRKMHLKITKGKIKPMTIEEFYSSIERAEEDIISERIYTQEKAEKESEKW